MNHILRILIVVGVLGGVCSMVVAGQELGVDDGSKITILTPR